MPWEDPQQARELQGAGASFGFTYGTCVAPRAMRRERILDRRRRVRCCTVIGGVYAQSGGLMSVPLRAQPREAGHFCQWAALTPENVTWRDCQKRSGAWEISYINIGTPTIRRRRQSWQAWAPEGSRQYGRGVQSKPSHLGRIARSLGACSSLGLRPGISAVVVQG
jgi:hypothetical protein